MPQPATILDVPAGETVRLGSQMITFTAAGNLRAEDIQFTKALRSVDLPDTVGRDLSSGYSSIKGVGSMTVQLSTVSSTIQHGDTGNIVLSNGTTMPFFVTSASEVYTHLGAAKIQITFAEWIQYSPITQVVTYDGPVGTPRACTPVVYQAHNLPTSAHAIVVRQKWCVLGTSFVASSMNSAGPVCEGRATYLVAETEPEDTGAGGMVTWYKTWASIPDDWNSKVSVPKNYQLAMYVIEEPGNITRDISIIGYTQVIKATQFHDYFLDDSSGSIVLPTVPSVMLIKYMLYGTQIWDGGTGFPTDGSGRYTSNYGSSFITGRIVPYLGKMVCLERIYG